MKVYHNGKFTVTYENSVGETSAFRCTPDVGALFAAAPDLLEACENAVVVLDSMRAAITKARTPEPLDP